MNKNILKYKLFVKLNSYFVLFFIYFFNPKKKNKKYCLVLSSERFRGEIEILKKDRKFEFIIFPIKMLNYLLMPFENELLTIKNSYFENNKKSILLRKKIQSYFVKILNPLFKYYNIKFMLGASCFYKRDNDISLAGKILGAKYIVFLRENVTPFDINNFVKYYDGRIVTKPDLIFAQCISTSRAYKKMKIFSGVEIKNFGSLRMSNFIKKIQVLRKRKNFQKKSTKKKNILFFSFTYNTLLEFEKKSTIGAFSKEGLVRLFRNSHNAIIDFAKRNENINITIRTKWDRNWHQIIISNWLKHSGKNELPKNLKITSEGNVHDMMLKTDLVISFFSTAMFESGLRDIPVIFLYFDEIASKFKHVLNIMWIKKSYFICTNYQKLENDIQLQFKNFKITKNLRKNRDHSFEECVSVLKQRSSKELINLINKII